MPERSMSKPDAEAEQAGDLAADVDRALGRAHDPRQDLEQRALAGAVRPDDGERLAVAQLERSRGAAPRTAPAGGAGRSSRPTSGRSSCG